MTTTNESVQHLTSLLCSTVIVQASTGETHLGRLAGVSIRPGALTITLADPTDNESAVWTIRSATSITSACAWPLNLPCVACATTIGDGNDCPECGGLGSTVVPCGISETAHRHVDDHAFDMTSKAWILARP